MSWRFADDCEISSKDQIWMMMIFLAEFDNLILSFYRRQMSHQQFSTHSRNRTDIDLLEHQKYSVVSSSHTSSFNSTISDSIVDVWKHEVDSYIYVLFRAFWFDRSMLNVSWVQAISKISSLCWWDNIICSIDRDQNKQIKNFQCFDSLFIRTQKFLIILS